MRRAMIPRRATPVATGMVIALDDDTMMPDHPRSAVGVNPFQTSYLGLRLEHPFMAGASPLSAHLDGVRRLEDAGAGAIVLHSLFEEQITDDETGQIHGIDPFDDPARAPLVDMFPRSADYPFEPHEYLEHLRRVKGAVAIDQMRGRVSLRASADPANFERASYIHMLHRWKP
jgi:hypothetical protein